jgi:hypothetical protein
MIIDDNDIHGYMNNLPLHSNNPFAQVPHETCPDGLTQACAETSCSV